jgi:hypothetical protein
MSTTGSTPRVLALVGLIVTSAALAVMATRWISDRGRPHTELAEPIAVANSAVTDEVNPDKEAEPLTEGGKPATTFEWAQRDSLQTGVSADPGGGRLPWETERAVETHRLASFWQEGPNVEGRKEPTIDLRDDPVVSQVTAAVRHAIFGDEELDRQNFDGAIAEYTMAIELWPGRAKLFTSRARAWYLKGDLEKALDDCTEAIRLDPNEATATTTGA